ncbi:hypothetical protein C361_00386 [Cryptococcus neoformans Tu259-1]|uniref:Uncharacterized protein n=1 Tax=Cryptococcus neoformans Tu259-1 TaxID=1230072 RepID=A0A854QIM4_CRYNE|nr:hypothetical protein C361_00386 [Cryptococcus neoformans var. grubii Tu259-1]
MRTVNTLIRSQSLEGQGHNTSYQPSILVDRA